MSVLYGTFSRVQNGLCLMYRPGKLPSAVLGCGKFVPARIRDSLSLVRMQVKMGLIPNDMD